MLTTLAMPSPMPAAAAQSRASGHEKLALVGSKGEGAPASLRKAWNPALMSFRASSPPSIPMPVETSFHIRSRVTFRIYRVVILVVSVNPDLSRSTSTTHATTRVSSLRFCCDSGWVDRAYLMVANVNMPITLSAVRSAARERRTDRGRTHRFHL